MMTLMWLRGLLGRRGGRLAATALGITFAVALLAALGSFLGASKATMTQRAIGQVAVDWQVEVAPGAAPGAVLAGLRSGSPVAAALPVGYATTLSTGAGMVLGLPAGYQPTFPGEVRYLDGSGSGVLLAQQTAANLHAAVGDTVSIARVGLPPVRVRVSAIVDLPQADSLFQRVAVARALATAPRVILADEPTGQLDSAHAAEVAALLLEAATRLGAALVLATHDLTLAGRLPERWQMADGRMLTEDDDQ